MALLNRLFKHTDLMLGMGMILMVGMLILPLPEFILDFGLVIAIATAVIILLTAVNCDEPLHFSVFPSLLIVTTLFRAGLSIAAMKLILGSGSAGHVIQTFGEFVLGGNFVVGLISFLILMIVQFIVITNGATRVSEVVARFTLDAMPGKQMAIDADLAAGLIDEREAKKRRKTVKQEADFYGSMDGASKFVKGDAIASLLIITINIIGGFIMGFMRGEGNAMDILSTYALLSVGEGLVSQIPALLISTASGLLVTRNGQETGMGGTMFGQLLSQPRVLMTTGVALGIFAFVPGFPTIIFLGLGGTLVFLSRLINNDPGITSRLRGEKPEEEAPAQEAPVMPSGPEAVMSLVNVDAIEIEIGYSLTRLADARAGGDLADRVAATRRQIALDLGYVMPSVRIRDNAVLRPTEYVFKIRGEEVVRAEAIPDQLLAIDSGMVINPVHGAVTKEPVFGLDAIWLEPGLRETAERAGYTVVEPASMMTTHLGEVIKTHAAELLTRQEVSQLVDNVRETQQAIVSELEPNNVTTGDIQKVLQHLLREKVPIRDMVTILETIVDFAGRVKEMEQMGELVRSAIARTITRQYLDEEGSLHCFTIEPAMENILQEAIQVTAGGSVLSLAPDVSRDLINKIKDNQESAATAGHTPILICSTQVRLPLRRLLERNGIDLPIVAYNEVSAQANVEFIGQITSGQASSVETSLTGESSVA